MKQILWVLLVCLLLPACQGGKEQARLRVSNPTDRNRSNELTEIPGSLLVPKLEGISKDSLVITDEAGHAIPYQWLSGTKGGEAGLLLPLTIRAHKTTVYHLRKGTPAPFTPQVYGRFVPERKDDFAWENDRVAFRAYGPALEATGEVSNGIDLWVKKTEALVINKWYQDDLSGTASYHEDHGEGLDFYKVGRTLGAGTLAPYTDDSLWLGNNFTAYEVLEAGPLRFSFRLSYAPFLVNDQPVTETRTFTLDAGSYLNCITETFRMTAESMPVAAGIVLRPEAGGSIFNSAFEGYAAYAEPSVEGKGTLFTAVVRTTPFTDICVRNGHLLSIGICRKDTPYTYYAGGSWSQSGFDTPEAWCSYVQTFARNLREPLILE